MEQYVWISGALKATNADHRWFCTKADSIKWNGQQSIMFHFFLPISLTIFHSIRCDAFLHMCLRAGARTRVYNIMTWSVNKLKILSFKSNSIPVVIIFVYCCRRFFVQLIQERIRNWWFVIIRRMMLLFYHNKVAFDWLQNVWVYFILLSLPLSLYV